MVDATIGDWNRGSNTDCCVGIGVAPSLYLHCIKIIAPKTKSRSLSFLLFFKIFLMYLYNYHCVQENSKFIFFTHLYKLWQWYNEIPTPHCSCFSWCKKLIKVLKKWYSKAPVRHICDHVPATGRQLQKLKILCLKLNHMKSFETQNFEALEKLCMHL